MNEAYRKYVISCWIWSRDTVMKDLPDDLGEYDQDLIIMLFNKVCQPYHYWKEQGERINHPKVGN